MLVACDDPDPSGKSSSSAKGSKADSPKDDSDEEESDEGEDEDEDEPPRKIDAGKGTAKKDASAPTTVMSDPNQIRPKDPPVHGPAAAAVDAGAPTDSTQPQADAGATASARDAGAPRPSSDGGK